MSDWCILRTAGRSTLGLAESLAKDGYEVWTPVETKVVRIPHANVKRETKKPILASYVFARRAHLVDLLELAAMPVKPRRGAGLKDPAHASFSVMHAFGRIPMIADRHLDRMRTLEAKRTPRKHAPYSFPRNSATRVTGGICEGMTGLVVRSTPKATVLQMVGGHAMEIPTCLLEIDVAYREASAVRKAA